MSYTPIGMPEAQTNFLNEGAPKLNLSDATRQAMQNALTQTIEGSLTGPIVEFYNKHFGKQNMLTAEEAKLKYPNVDYPKGGDEWVIRRNSENKTRNDYTNMLMSSTAHPWIASNAGTLIANILSPAGIILGALSGGAGNALEASLAPKVTSVLAKAAIKVGAGATSGLVAGVPLTAAQAYAQSQIQEPMTSEDVGKNILAMVGLGAALHTVFGAKVPLSAEDQKMALRAAQAQVDAGKKVSIDKIIQNALAKNVENPMELEETAAKSDYSNIIKQVEEKIPTPQERIKELNLKKISKEIASIKEDFPKEIDQSSSQSIDTLRKFADHIEKNSDKEKLTELFQSTENISLKSIRDEIQNYSQVFGNEKIKNISKFVDQLSEHEYIIDQTKKLQRDSEIYQEISNNKPEAPTPEEIIDARREMMSWEGNHAIFPNEYFNNEFVKNKYFSPEEETTLYENHVKSLDDAGILTEDDKASLEGLKEEQQNETTIASSLKNFINCLISGGGE